MFSSIPPRKRTIKSVKVEIRGNAGRTASFGKRLRIGPIIIPMIMSSKISGHPVFLNSIFAKKPITKIAAAMRNAIT